MSDNKITAFFRFYWYFIKTVQVLVKSLYKCLENFILTEFTMRSLYALDILWLRACKEIVMILLKFFRIICSFSLVSVTKPLEAACT